MCHATPCDEQMHPIHPRICSKVILVKGLKEVAKLIRSNVQAHTDISPSPIL